MVGLFNETLLLIPPPLPPGQILPYESRERARVVIKMTATHQQAAGSGVKRSLNLPMDGSWGEQSRGSRGMVAEFGLSVLLAFALVCCR